MIKHHEGINYYVMKMYTKGRINGVKDSKITVNALPYENGRNIKRLREVLVGQRNMCKGEKDRPCR